MEIWENIKGYESIYKISNYGRVKNITLYNHYVIKNNKIIKDYKYIHKYNKFRQNKILKITIDNNGYYMCNLYNNTIRKTHRIHKLVAQHFIPNPDNKPCVNHIDGNKLNNNINNLEWCTYSENMKHAYIMGLKKPNNNSMKVKISKYNFNKTFDSTLDCSKYLNCSIQNISQCINNNNKCKGYIVNYI